MELSKQTNKAVILDALFLWKFHTSNWAKDGGLRHSWPAITRRECLELQSSHRAKATGDFRPGQCPCRGRGRGGQDPNDEARSCLATASIWRYCLSVMNVAIEIPETVSDSLRLHWKDVPRRVLEAVAAEAYRSSALTAHQVGELLGHGSRWETEAFLKQAQAYLHYSEDDLERDLEALRAARG